MVEKLKREFIKLLEEDKEFRYTVAGYLGLSEVLKSLDELGKKMLEMEERFNKRLLEIEERFNERFLKLEERVVKLEEGHKRIWENIEKLWKEIRELKRSVSSLEKSVNRLEEHQERTWRTIEQLGRSVGMTLDHYTAAFLRGLLSKMGYPEADVKAQKSYVYKGRDVEINVFCEEPLLVGEVTTYIGSKEDAENEVEKLLERVRIVEELFNRRVKFKVLTVANVKKDALDFLKKLVEKEGIFLYLGREILTK